MKRTMWPAGFILAALFAISFAHSSTPLTHEPGVGAHAPAHEGVLSSLQDQAAARPSFRGDAFVASASAGSPGFGPSQSGAVQEFRAPQSHFGRGALGR